MSGILFFKTEDMESISEFYTKQVGATVWLDQNLCTILKHGNLLLGFCQSESSDTNGIITFFYSTRKEVDNMYRRLRKRAQCEPRENEKFSIYHFFAQDPEGRAIEFQCFLHPLSLYQDGTEILQNRRSIRHYQDTPVPEDVLWEIFEVCRFSPTSRNSQSYYYIVIKNQEILEYLAELRGEPSAPLKRAPLAVAVVSNPEQSGAYLQDGCIAAYHFMLAAHSHGLGTCWIAAMDRPEVKKILGVPESHYIATLTPTGYPVKVPETPPRKNAQKMVKFID